MAGRADVARRIGELVGDDVLRITDAATGWPAFGELLVEGEVVTVAIFAGPVTSGHRGRDVERRFQNPGGDRPITQIAGRDTLLLGLWEEDELVAVKRPILVSADAAHRLGRTTRFSIFVGMTMLQAALETGWAEGENAVGERIRCFAPPLLPLSHAADRDNAAPASNAMQAAIGGSGLLDAPDEESAAASERARRAGTILVRDARFSRRVVAAYDGLCAMCGLDVGLVQGAHIYPASAPGSPDEPWNGLALCANHHLAFDKHLVAVDPETLEIHLHDDIGNHAQGNWAVHAFVEGTFPRLTEPADPSLRVRSEMFVRRYEFFAEACDWVFEP